MPEWKPEPIWKDQDVFVIGGGTSLRGFDWSLLKNENTIGCNNAFRLGPGICKVCLFVDRKFIFDRPNHPRANFYDKLAEYAKTNWVVTNDTQLKTRPEPWIKWMPRKPKGLHHDALGYNANCGASAVNLALLMGASVVYLLGIDMHLDGNKRPNWHDCVIDKPSEDVYSRMSTSFIWVGKDLPLKFPGRKIFNVNGNSNLNVFPKLDPKVFWAERKRSNENVDEDVATENNMGGVGIHSNHSHTAVV